MDQASLATTPAPDGVEIGQDSRETKLGSLLNRLEGCNRQLFEITGGLEGFHGRLGGAVPLSEVPVEKPEKPSCALDRLASEIETYGAGVERLRSVLSNLSELS